MNKKENEDIKAVLDSMLYKVTSIHHELKLNNFGNAQHLIEKLQDYIYEQMEECNDED